MTLKIFFCCLNERCPWKLPETLILLNEAFFDTDIFPNWLSVITNNLPLSPLVNSLRESALYGTNTLELLPELTIIIVWIVAAFIIGIKTFKWEWFNFFSYLHEK